MDAAFLSALRRPDRHATLGQMFRRTIAHGVDYVSGRGKRPRHQHTEAYATIVLGGAYEQNAYAGRLTVEAGDIVIQPTFDCHNDHIFSEGVEVIRLPWKREASVGGVHRGVAIDDIVREARSDVRSAAESLADALGDRKPLAPAMVNWADALAAALREDPALRIGLWAAAAGISREYATRCFRATYEVTPVRFRGEFRAREAWLKLTASNAPLTAVALDHGFADQAHMSRVVKWLTGASPTWWRRAKGLPLISDRPFVWASRELAAISRP
jgi:AraC-like DNA-binding protein